MSSLTIDPNVVVQLGLLEYQAGNFSEAAQWWQGVAKDGHAQAQLYLGTLYYNGKGVSQSYERAFDWFTKSAEQGNAQAQYSLGLCYERGNGVTQSPQDALEWYLKAAKQGNEKAQAKIDSLLGTSRGPGREKS